MEQLGIKKNKPRKLTWPLTLVSHHSSLRYNKGHKAISIHSKLHIF